MKALMSELFVITLNQLIYYWIKTEKEFKNDGKGKPIEKIKDNSDKTRDVNNQMIRESDLKNKTSDSKPREESSVSDIDFNKVPVSKIDDTKEEKTWSTITCTGSREIRSPQSAPASELLESFGDYSPSNFRSPESNVKSDANQTEANQSSDRQKQKSEEELQKSNEKISSTHESQTKPEDISLVIPDNNLEESDTKSV